MISKSGWHRSVGDPELSSQTLARVVRESHKVSTFCTSVNMVSGEARVGAHVPCWHLRCISSGSLTSASDLALCHVLWSNFPAEAAATTHFLLRVSLSRLCRQAETMRPWKSSAKRRSTSAEDIEHISGRFRTLLVFLSDEQRPTQSERCQQRRSFFAGEMDDDVTRKKT